MAFILKKAFCCDHCDSIIKFIREDINWSVSTNGEGGKTFILGDVTCPKCGTVNVTYAIRAMEEGEIDEDDTPKDMLYSLIGSIEVDYPPGYWNKDRILQQLYNIVDCM